MTLVIEIIVGLMFVFLFVWFTVQFYNMVFRGYAPFISTRKEVIDRIISELDLREDAIVKELGCGKAGFLRALRKKYPKAHLLGYEYSLFPYLAGQIQNSFAKSHLHLFRENIFKTNICDADLVYCYLNIKTMKDLRQKFKQQCKKGTIIVSYQFPLPDMKPEKVVEVDGRKDKVYFYRT